MSLPERVIRPTAAEHVREGDWVLAAWEGTLGIWRVTMTQPGHDRANAAAVHLTVTLHLVRINSSGERMVQLHRWDALVPVLVPIPEPPTVTLEAQTLEPQRSHCNVRIEIVPHSSDDERKPCKPVAAEDYGNLPGVPRWRCAYCGTEDWKLRCPAR